ncbi:proteasome inhibitor PI31 subunit isoform X2 [Monomorium pharaonis]|uniref:proteasome inhibitor PI31 subunit isoform X2 n=1 Tax=Monomorium pharaonis TaxID=307658 RepID=UPI0017471006|nr:proteasome inhibitor PI31 subunit isoform X2 [Monomorium pharaonis]
MTELNALEKGSELFPPGWNSYPNYTLRYVKNEKLYVLLGVKSDMDLLLNMMRHHDNSVSTIQLPINETVSALHGPLEIIIPLYQTVLQNIYQDFIKSTCDSNEAATQTTVQNNECSSETNKIPTQDNHPLREPSHWPSNRPEYDPMRVGVRDLDPFREGGGMIFDPFSMRPPSGHGLGVPGRLPSGAIPPGARFNPFGPPELDPYRRPHRRPDDDHLPPPGYDDMFQ